MSAAAAAAAFPPPAEVLGSDEGAAAAAAAATAAISAAAVAAVVTVVVAPAAPLPPLPPGAGRFLCVAGFGAISGTHASKDGRIKREFSWSLSASSSAEKGNQPLFPA